MTKDNTELELGVILKYLVAVVEPDKNGQSHYFSITEQQTASEDAVALAKAKLLAWRDQYARQVAAEAVLMGAARELDNLWSGSRTRCGHETSELIRQRMIMLFGEDWTSNMYVNYLDKLRERQTLNNLLPNSQEQENV
jgi:hypothetical protein